MEQKWIEDIVWKEIIDSSEGLLQVRNMPHWKLFRVYNMPERTADLRTLGRRYVYFPTYSSADIFVKECRKSPNQKLMSEKIDIIDIFTKTDLIALLNEMEYWNAVTY